MVVNLLGKRGFVEWGVVRPSETMFAPGVRLVVPAISATRDGLPPIPVAHAHQNLARSTCDLFKRLDESRIADGRGIPGVLGVGCLASDDACRDGNKKQDKNRVMSFHLEL